MDHYKVMRELERVDFWEQVRLVEEELVKDPLDKVALELEFGKLQNIVAQLKILDSEFLALLVKKKVDPDVHKQEHLEKKDIGNKVYDVERRVATILTTRPTTPPPNAHGQPHNNQKNVRLPKIELRKFNGELKEWLGFWAQFQKIHEDDSIVVSDKFDYLRQSMAPGSTARDLVDSYPASTENYPKVVQALKEEYGDEGLLLQVYIRELLRMVVNNATQKTPLPLKKMHLQLASHRRALASLNLATIDPDTWLFPLVESSLPEELIRVWRRSDLSKRDGKAENPPKTGLDYLMEFVESEVKGEQWISLAKETFADPTASESNKNSSGNNSSKRRSGEGTGIGRHQRRGLEPSRSEDFPTAAGLVAGSDRIKNPCIFCGKHSNSQNCRTAKNMSQEDKQSAIKEKRACFKCLQTGHGIRECKNSVQCNTCDKDHATIMCPLPRRESTAPATETATTASNFNSTTGEILQTVKVMLVNSKKKKIVRALCDPGSQKSYILKKTAEFLQLPSTGKIKLRHTLCGGSMEVKEHLQYSISVQDTRGHVKKIMEVLSQDEICGKIPRMKKGPWMEELRRKKIFVEDIGEGDPEIELLIGSGYYLDLITGRKEKLSNGLNALQTSFGWIVAGEVNLTAESNLASVTSMHIANLPLSNLWDLDQIGICDPVEHQSKKQQDEEALEHFHTNTSRQEDGRYTVKLPWINEKTEIPTNLSIAKVRLENATRKLIVNDQYDAYGKLFDEWKREGIIEEVDSAEEDGHFLPHRPVFKESATTPVRPVFDASCKGKRAPSLNECLHKGPNLVDKLPSVLMRFREKKIGFTSDIRKAFQMISVEEADRRFLKFLWWEEALKKIKIFRHARVPFGLNCSPFLLQAVIIKQCTAPGNSTAISNRLIQSLYVDNCVSSANSSEEYEEFKTTTTALLAEAKMDLRQWERGSADTPQDEAMSTVLGLSWNKRTDVMSVVVPSVTSPQVFTKRNLLSAMQQVFDPLGIVAPALIIPKLILQEAWINNRNWDDDLPEDLSQKALSWMEEVPHLAKISIRRCVNPLEADDENLSLHTFVDASQDAYAAVIFLRAEKEGDVSVRFISAKSRIAPIPKAKRKAEPEARNRASIPRLELLAATIGARLTHQLVTTMEWQHIPQYFWGDSTTVLAWIRRNDDWGTFVGNRVREILRLSRSEDWRHVPGKLNPADLPSRGCSPLQLSNSDWWEGPNWLYSTSKEWPNCQEEADEAEIATERKKSVVSLAAAAKEPKESWFPIKSNVYITNVKVMAWILRFIANIKKKNHRLLQPQLTSDELRTAERKLIKTVQEEYFPNGPKDIRSLRTEFRENLLCVNSRLLYRTDVEDFKFPIVLPPNSEIVEQLVNYVHRNNGHAGTQFVLGKIREKYWIIRGRKTVRQIIRKCVICRRFTAPSTEVIPAPLPKNRVESQYVFQTTGVDLAGPLQLKDGSKVWVVLFTCAVYRALHLELVDSLSTETFLRALERFIAIQGRPNVLYSDNGTNFVGTANIFKKLNWQKVQDESNIKEIRWIFNPPTAAWWGGWWERLVRSIKDLLKRMLGKTRATFDELRTILAAIQSTINDRPLTTLTEDQEDLIPLTPSHFMRGSLTGEFCEGQQIGSQELQGRYAKMQNLKKSLQARFRKEYLALLVQTSTERDPPPLKHGSIVLVGADNKKRFEWPLGRIVELLPGPDGNVRAARVKTAIGILVRPIQRLYSLEIPISEALETPPEVKEKVVKKKSIPPPEPEVQRVTRAGRVIKKAQKYGSWIA